jgi:hypothetical protein
LLDLKALLEEGLDVYEQLTNIFDFDFDNLSPEDIAAIVNMVNDYDALSEEARELLDPETIAYYVSLTLEFIEDLVEDLPESIEDFEALFNDPETKDDVEDALLDAWASYQSLSPELKDQLDPEARAQLEALYARYQELLRPTSNVNLMIIGLLIIHLSAGAYFAFKKRDDII